MVRRVIIPCLLLCSMLLKSMNVLAYSSLSAYDRIMAAVAERNGKLLREMVSEGININARNAQGQTALCTTLSRGDSTGYRMLFNQGATVHTPCIRQIPPERLQSFYFSNPDLGRYVDGRILVPDVARQASSSSTSFVGGIPWPHLGEFALLGAAVGVAVLVGGGGKGGQNSATPGINPSLYKSVETGLSLEDFPTLGGYWKDPTLTFVEKNGKSAAQNYREYADQYYENLETNNLKWFESGSKKYAWEYNGGDFTNGSPWNYYTRDLIETTGDNITTTTTQDTFHLMNPIAYLPMVNAASAWVRGYTGYVVDRSDVENPKITKEKIKVAVMDTGLEVDEFAHTELASNIASFDDKAQMKTRLNYAYGPCSSNNKEKCWTFNVKDNKAYLVSNIETSLIDSNSTPANYEAVYNFKSRSKWNEYAGQYARECSTTVTTNCLKFEIAPNSSTYTAIYYPEGVSTASATAEDVVKYSIDSILWHEYELKGYGVTGYIYDENDPTPGLLSNDGLWAKESHGTHVSGILAAARDGKGIAGVAPDAEIIPVRVDFQTNQVMNHLKDVVEKTDAKVVNLSLGSEDVHLGQEAYDYYYQEVHQEIGTNNDIWNGFFSNDTKDGYNAAAKKETVLVFAAGNEAKMQPSINVVAPLVGESDDPKTNYAKSAFKNLLISVVALDENKKIAYFGTDDKGVRYESNRCGSSSMYCLAAPGGSNTARVGSTTMGDNYALGAGTSQATPVVTGSVAVLMGAFPFLKPQEVVQILFETADYIEPTAKEISDYNSASQAAGDGQDAYEKNTVEGKYNAIYGHGLVNLDKATDPIGLPKISFDSVASSPFAINASSTNVIIPVSLAHTLSALPKNIVVLDKYTRPYAMPTSRFVNTEKRTDALKRSFQSFMALDEKMVEANDHLSFGYTEAPSDSVGIPTGSMTMQMKPTKDMSLRMGYTQDTKSFGGTYSDRIVQNPFINMRQAWGSDIAYRVAGHWSLTGGFKYGQNGFIDSDIVDKMSEKPMVSIMQTGVRYAPKKSVVFDMSFGQMNEEESLLGLRGAGAFETDGNKTRFVSIGTSVMPFDKWQLSASYTYGMTDANETQTLMKFSRLTSDAFALAALYRPDEMSTYGFKVASPLRVRSGTVTFDLPTARDMYEDRLYRTQYTSDMKPDAREYDLSLFFMNQLKEQLLIAGEAGVRLHPDHQKEAKPDYQTLFKLQYQY